MTNHDRKPEDSFSNTLDCSACFDRTAVLSRVAGDEECLLDLIRTFLVECGPMMSDIRASIEKRDCVTLERAAHKLKGAASVFDAKAVSDAAFELEQIGLSCAADDAQGTFARLEKQIAIFKLALSEFERGLCAQKS